MMKLPLLILIAGTMGVANALPLLPSPAPIKDRPVPVSPVRAKRVVADTERGSVRDISYNEPEIDAEDIDDSSLTLTDEAEARAEYAQWAWGLADQQPDLFTEDVGDAHVIIDVNKSTQRGKIIIGGKEVENFKLSTGKYGRKTETPSGTFRPGARKVNWLSNFASRQYKRPIYLKHAVQIKGGSFMHAASSGAMNYLGQRRSSGCVRVPPHIAAKVYNLINSTKAIFRVH